MATEGEEAHAHRHRVVVRWGDCDPAGIVYYPRYYDYFHQAMETWFQEVAGVPYAEMIVGRKIGFPSVHTEADYRRPSTFGDALDVEIFVTRFSRRSIHFGFRVYGVGEEDPRVTGSKVVVAMDLDPQSDGYRQAVALPDPLPLA